MSQAILTKSDNLNMLGSHTNEVAGGLSRALASTFSLYLKTLNYHWNVEGEMFLAIHELTERHYLNMASAIDKIAERIRMLGFYSPGSYREFEELSLIKFEKAAEQELSSQKMLQDLEKSHGDMISFFKELRGLSETSGDTSTADLLSERCQFHEKAAWMLRSMLK